MLRPFSSPVMDRKAVAAAFDRRRTSDSGATLPATAEGRRWSAEGLAHGVPDRHDPSRITRTLAETARAGILAIADGRADADDLDSLTVDAVPYGGEPAFVILDIGAACDVGHGVESEKALDDDRSPSAAGAFGLRPSLAPFRDRQPMLCSQTCLPN